MEGIGLLVGVGGVEDGGLSEVTAGELEADGEACTVKATGYGDGGTTSEIEDDV